MDLLHQLWTRAEGAIEALAQAYGHQLYQTAFHILGSRQDAEECVSDTYLAVWNSIPPAKPDSLAAYVLRIGRNTALNRLRVNQAQKRDSRYDLSLDELTDCFPGPQLEEALNWRELGRAIDAFLSTVKKENRIIFVRRYWFGDSVRDIARLTGCSENLISVRLSRTRHQLKQYLIKEGFFDA